MRSICVAVFMVICFLQSSCDSKSTQNGLSPTAVDKKAAGLFSRRYMGAIPCEQDELIEFVHTYANNPLIRKAFTRDPVITKHVSLDGTDLIYGKTAADKLSSTHGFSEEHLANGKIVKRIDDQTFEIQIRGDSRFTHTFSHDSVCWHYESLTDRSDDACDGLPEEKCRMDAEDDMEGLDHD